MGTEQCTVGGMHSTCMHANGVPVIMCHHKTGAVVVVVVVGGVDVAIVSGIAMVTNTSVMDRIGPAGS